MLPTARRVSKRLGQRSALGSSLGRVESNSLDLDEHRVGSEVLDVIASGERVVNDRDAASGLGLEGLDGSRESGHGEGDMK